MRISRIELVEEKMNWLRINRIGRGKRAVCLGEQESVAGNLRAGNQ